MLLNLAAQGKTLVLIVGDPKKLSQAVLNRSYLVEIDETMVGKEGKSMQNLTPEERKRIKLAGQIARDIRYVLIFFTACVVAVAVWGFYILAHGGH